MALRLLLAADVAGLALGFVLSQLFFEPSSKAADQVSPEWEDLVFLRALPIWVLAAQLSGLYGRNGRRADHSTVDDLLAVFAVVTIGDLAFLGGCIPDAGPEPESTEARSCFWAMAIAFVVAGRLCPRARAPVRDLPKTRSSSARGRPAS